MAQHPWRKPTDRPLIVQIYQGHRVISNTTRIDGEEKGCQNPHGGGDIWVRGAKKENHEKEWLFSFATFFVYSSGSLHISIEQSLPLNVILQYPTSPLGSMVQVSFKPGAWRAYEKVEAKLFPDSRIWGAKHWVSLERWECNRTRWCVHEILPVSLT